MENKKYAAHIAILVANIIFGTNIPVSRLLMPELISPYAFTFLRFSGGMMLFWMVSFFVKSEEVPAKDLLMMFFASLFAFTLNQIPFFVGLSMTSPIDASIVVTLLPIITMVLAALFLKEPITGLKAVGVLVGASGALLIVLNQPHLHGKESNTLGNIIIFLAATSFAVYLTLFKNLIIKYHPVTVMKWMFLFATITGLPMGYSALKSTHFELFTLIDFYAIGFTVIFATFLGYILIPIGQKGLRPTTLSMYNYIQPMMAALIAILAGIDHFGYRQAMAAVLVFSGVYLVTQSKSRAQVEAEIIQQIPDKKIEIQ